MPRTCTICRHDRLADIDTALVDRRPFRSIAKQFSVGASALLRHHDDHLPAKLLRAKRVAEAVEADALLDHLLDLRAKALDILVKAGAEGNHGAAIGAIREARNCLELMGKLEYVGAFRERVDSTVTQRTEQQVIEELKQRLITFQPDP